jgi:4-hydroxy-2-oxoheptanedioate aldolase
VNGNPTLEKLSREGEVAFGCFLRYPDAGLAELLALAGLDFVVFDGAHGTLTPAACEHMVRAVELHGVTPLVRVEENRAASILRYMDCGVLGCHVPGVTSAEEAVSAVRAVKFRPQGDRGLAASRASAFGTRADYATYTAEANRRTQLVVHVESAAGVDAADAIAAVDGVDVLFVGLLDLSQDLGVPGEVDHPAVVAAAQRVASAAADAGKLLGVPVTDARAAQRWAALGARYVVTTVESFIFAGVRRLARELHHPPTEEPSVA